MADADARLARRRQGRLNRALLAVRLVMLWERSAGVWAPFLIGAAAVATLGLWGALEPLPLYLHWGALGLVIAGAAAWAVAGAARVRWPGREEALRRLEQDSRLHHAPLRALEDRPVGGDEALWALHRAQAEQALESVRPGKPKAGLAAADPFALRYVVAVLAGLGLFAQGTPGLWRMAEAFQPDLKADADELIVQAWVEPPAYTGQAPIPLVAGDRVPVGVPEGAVLTVRVQGAAGAPGFVGVPGRFARGEGDQFEGRAVLTRSGEVVVRRGRHRFAWPVEVTPNARPVIRFAEAPRPGRLGGLDFAYAVSDDYGVETVVLELRAGLKVVRQELGRPDATGAVEERLPPSRFPFEGERVSARLIAVDAAGREGASRAVTVDTPELVFTQPAARQIAAAGRAILAERLPYAGWPLFPAERAPSWVGPVDNLHRAPPGVREAVVRLNHVPAAGLDPTAVAGLSWSLRKLQSADSIGEARRVGAELMDVAARLERGRLGRAEEELAAARERLREAAARGADRSEIAPLMAQARRALNDYAEAVSATSQGRTAAEEGAGRAAFSATVDQVFEQVRAAGEREGAAGAARAFDALARALTAAGADGRQGGAERVLRALAGEAESLDPLGRRAAAGRSAGANPGATGSTVASAPAATARDAMARIQERAADRERDPEELDYLERLMRRF